MRVKGQNVKVIPMVNGAQANTAFAFVKSLDMEFQHEVLTEDYLGEANSRRSSVFSGVTGTVEVNFESPDLLTFLSDYTLKAKDQTAAFAYDVLVQITLPLTGEQPTITLRNVFFSGINLSAGDRKDFVGTSWQFEAEDYTIETA